MRLSVQIDRGVRRAVGSPLISLVVPGGHMQSEMRAVLFRLNNLAKEQMPAVNLGINSESIQYEVALEILGQERQPFVAAINLEKAKAKPSAAFLRYCEMRLLALDELQGNLRTTDRDTIEQILDQKNELFR